MTVDDDSTANSDSSFVEPHTWTVLPNSRLGYALPPARTEVGWKQVFRATDFTTMLCHHGEKVGVRRRRSLRVTSLQSSHHRTCALHRRAPFVTE